ncbi:type II secretion system protein N [Kangiella geojedonensis]|uniref:Type II secretion system protein N n=1 Tax=Kangiella geojedonensis TaxID=914150 RepID=A0A0F6RB47_9GAMM|nr:type II secretion system protein N [Kangiella geojedonensis]AKE51263.1 hypothetical protein TQ33_0274 [Kangiella geojedonensis]
MKKIIVGAVIALILFIAILLMLAPARVATPWITDAVPELYLTNVSGSIWSSHIEQAKYRNLTINNIELQPSAIALLWGALETSINIQDPKISLEAEAVLSRNNYSVKNANFDVDTAYVASLIKVPIDGLSGRVNGQVSILDYSKKSLKQLSGEGQWNNAVILYPNNNLDIGNVSFKLSKSGQLDNAARIDIMDNQGVLDLKGFIEVGLNKQFRMNIHATNQLPAHLKNWLTRWGRQDGNRIYLEWQGRLP